ACIKLDLDKRMTRYMAPDQLLALAQHLDALFERKPPPARLDEHLIEDLRRQLQQMSVAQRVYNRVKRQKLPDGLPDFRISEAAGRDGALVFTRKSGKPLNEPLSGFYTYRGYRQVFMVASLSQSGALAEEQWVLGRQLADNQDVASLALDVRNLYFQDFLNQWETLLGDIDFVAITSVAQAADVLRVLSGPNSPLKQLLEAVARETDLQQEDRLLAEKLKGADGTVDKLKQQLGSLVGQPSPTQAQEAPQVDPITARFNELN